MKFLIHFREFRRLLNSEIRKLGELVKLYLFLMRNMIISHVAENRNL